MAKLHVFNPEHDIALASHQWQFTSPRAGRQLREDLCWLPVFWAAEGDAILVSNSFDINQLSAEYQGFRFVTLDDICNGRFHLSDLSSNDATSFFDVVSPWGFDRAIAHSLGFVHTPELTSRLDKIRMLSSRQWCASHLQQDVDYCTSCLEVETSISRHAASSERVKGQSDNSVVFKSPWSSSGRGVQFHYSEAWVASVIRRQGGIIVEPQYQKIIDFAFEYNSHDGIVEYAGLSLFSTSGGAYTGNILASEVEKERILAQYLSFERQNELRQSIIDKVSADIAPVYQGPFGVDMMIVDSGTASETPIDHYHVVVCELNLRRTMGHVALALSRTHLGEMQIKYDGNHYSLQIRE
jgi:hypothetical protein